MNGQGSKSIVDPSVRNGHHAQRSADWKSAIQQVGNLRYVGVSRPMCAKSTSRSSGF